MAFAKLVCAASLIALAVGCHSAEKKRAIDAIKRAYQYRDESVVAYEMRSLEADKAIAEVSDETLKQELSNCADFLRMYRSMTDEGLRGQARQHADKCILDASTF
jgi:hypothetical protein